jgi:hypothetical protein
MTPIERTKRVLALFEATVPPERLAVEGFSFGGYDARSVEAV